MIRYEAGSFAVTLVDVTSLPAASDSWNVHDSLGEGLAAIGDTKGAIKSYEKALSIGVSEENQKRIARILQELKAK